MMLLKDTYPQHDIGRASYGEALQVASWDDKTKLKVGAFCSFGPRVLILLGGEHRTDCVATYPFNPLWGSSAPGNPKTKGDVVIGNDVWIGMESMILSGVTIGDGAVIGARSVVTKNVGPYMIVAGNPARAIRCRFDAEIVQRLLKIKWWDWPDQKIREYMSLLLGPVSRFLEAVNV